MSLHDELKRLAEGATPGPWEVEVDTRSEFCRFTQADLSYTAGYNINGDGGEVVGIEGIIPGPHAEADAALIVALRNNLPAILSALKERDAMREALAMAFAAIDDHNQRAMFRSIKIEEFHPMVKAGSKIACLSDARQALEATNEQ